MHPVQFLALLRCDLQRRCVGHLRCGIVIEWWLVAFLDGVWLLVAVVQWYWLDVCQVFDWLLCRPLCIFH